MDPANPYLVLFFSANSVLVLQYHPIKMWYLLDMTF